MVTEKLGGGRRYGGEPLARARKKGKCECVCICNNVPRAHGSEIAGKTPVTQ